MAVDIVGCAVQWTGGGDGENFGDFFFSFWEVWSEIFSACADVSPAKKLVLWVRVAPNERRARLILTRPDVQINGLRRSGHKLNWWFK